MLRVCVCCARCVCVYVFARGLLVRYSLLDSLVPHLSHPLLVICVLKLVPLFVCVCVVARVSTTASAPTVFVSLVSLRLSNGTACYTVSLLRPLYLLSCPASVSLSLPLSLSMCVCALVCVCRAFVWDASVAR